MDKKNKIKHSNNIKIPLFSPLTSKKGILRLRLKPVKNPKKETFGNALKKKNIPLLYFFALYQKQFRVKKACKIGNLLSNTSNEHSAWEARYAYDFRPMSRRTGRFQFTEPVRKNVKFQGEKKPAIDFPFLLFFSKAVSRFLFLTPYKKNYNNKKKRGEMKFRTGGKMFSIIFFS